MLKRVQTVFLKCISITGQTQWHKLPRFSTKKECIWKPSSKVHTRDIWHDLWV